VGHRVRRASLLRRRQDLPSVGTQAIRSDRLDEYKAAALPDGTKFLIDPRAAKRLPGRFGLTVRGLGRFKHLDLDLDGDEWGELLYT
jgi:hypothetical protein